LVGQTYSLFVLMIGRESQKITNIVQFAFRKGLDRDEPIPVERQEWHNQKNIKLFAVEETPSVKKITPQLPNIYEQRLVAFVDLLGFSALVRDSSHNRASWLLINNLLLQVALECAFDTQIGTGHPLTWSQASDSLIVSCPFDPRQANIVLFRLKQLQLTLLRQFRTLCRGGIAIGQLIHVENVFYGPAYLEALCLEKGAKMPIIAISAPLATQLLRWEGYDRLIRTRLDQNTHFLDYFNPHPNGGLSATGLSGLREDIIALVASARMFNESIQAKYQWLIGYFNEVVQSVPGYGIRPL
jgi:hypothetical protein